MLCKSFPRTQLFALITKETFHLLIGESPDYSQTKKNGMKKLTKPARTSFHMTEFLTSSIFIPCNIVHGKLMFRPNSEGELTFL